MKNVRTDIEFRCEKDVNVVIMKLSLYTKMIPSIGYIKRKLEKKWGVRLEKVSLVQCNALGNNIRFRYNDYYIGKNSYKLDRDDINSGVCVLD